MEGEMAGLAAAARRLGPSIFVLVPLAGALKQERNELIGF